MRILFVNDRCGYFGGVEQNIALTAEALGRRGHECLLACADTGGDEAAAYRQRFSGVSACRDLQARPTMDAPTLADLVARTGADLLYLHKVSRLPELASLPASLPRVRMVHDHDLCCPRSHKYFATTGRVCTRAAGWRCYLDGAFLVRDREAVLGVRVRSLRGAFDELARNRALDRLLVGSVSMRDELLQNGFAAGRVRIVAPAVLDAPTQPLVLSTGRTVLYVGQLVRGKGVDLLLRAFALLRAGERAVDSPATRLLIVGQGNHEPALRRLTSTLGLDADVEFRGWVANDKLGTLYRAARLVAFPSRWPEPFGMVGLEAMRHARPVVGFDVGGVRDWLADGETGVLVREQDVDGFARGMARLLHEPGLAARMGAAAQSRVARRFAFDAYLDALEATFDECRRERALGASVTA